jgi:hypothetical protein
VLDTRVEAKHLAKNGFEGCRCPIASELIARQGGEQGRQRNFRDVPTTNLTSLLLSAGTIR